MSSERRDEITRLILAVFVQRLYLGKQHPVAYSVLVLSIQHCTDITREEIDHVLVALCCRLVVNLIAGEVYLIGAARELLVDNPLAIDTDRIDWLYGSGRYART